MSRMAVCYFCGTVVESPEPTPLLPPSLRGDDGGPTVDLCADCRGKYDTVRATVADAVEDRQLTPTVSGDEDISTTSDSGVDATDSGSDVLDQDAVTLGEDPGTVDYGASAIAEDTDADSAGADGVSADTDAVAEDETTDDDAAGERSESDAMETGGGAGPFADVSVSKADFRRVVRLLENRDLPVERSEFEAVASNAYDLPESTVAAVLDAAAERGLVAVEDGRIVDGE